ncbi:MAG: DUF4202 domain-containing protein [Balneolaceae bacterium]
MSNYQLAVKKMDEANSQDPNREMVEGRELPKELIYARRMTEWLAKLDPDASEALRLATRCQHIERWAIPREDYPMTRPGYLKWRNDLKRYHAERAGEILRDTGYTDELIRKVQDLVMKKGLKTDPEAQILEDVACLVFLAYYFEEFSQNHSEEKLVRIIRKTWRKMSEKGQAMAVNLHLSDSARRLMEKAVT